MKLVSVYRVRDAVTILYDLLKEREGRDDINISHRSMPTMDEHAAFVRSSPYHAWYLIQAEEGWAGSIYLSKAREVGIFLFERYQGTGVGSEALEELRRRWPGRMLANCNPKNERSMAFFEKHGFKPLQVTYELA